MEKKEIVIKITNQKIFLTPSLTIPIENTNIPIDYLKFKSQMEIFWIVEMLKYTPENKSLSLNVIIYNCVDTSNFIEKPSKRKIEKLIFDKFDWMQLEPLLRSHQKGKFKDILFNIDGDQSPKENKIKTISYGIDFSKIETERKISISQKIIVPELKHTVIKDTIEEKFQIHFKDITFKQGYVTFKKHIKKLNKEVIFQIFNEDILAEFEAIKFWFAKILKKEKINVVAIINLTDRIVTDTTATSEQIQQINSKIIDNVQYQRTFELTKPSIIKSPDKSLFTAEELFNQTNTEKNEGNIFNQSEQDILNLFLEKSDIRNKDQLKYLSGKKQSAKLGLRYTLHPHFGFLFFIEGKENNHFVWELLNSHATYIWSLNKSELSVELQFKKIEDTVNIIRTNGRENYKYWYRNNKQDNNFVFKIVKHEKTDSEFSAHFPKWKAKMNVLLV